MRRLIPLLAIVGIVAVVALRSWTSDNLAPFRGQVQDVITLALSLLIESLPFIVLGIALSIVVQVFVPTSWLESWLPENPFARRAIVSLFGMFLPVCECGNVPLARGLLGRGYGVGTGISQALSLVTRKQDGDLRKVLDYGLDRLQTSGQFARVYGRFFPS